MESPRRSVLVVTSRFPYPPIGGERLRIWTIISHLARRFDVDLLVLYGDPADVAGMAEVQHTCRTVRAVRVGRRRKLMAMARGWLDGHPMQVGMYNDRTAQDAVDEMIRDGHPDVVLCHLVRTLEYSGRTDPGRVILELTDAISMNYERITRPSSVQELVYVVERRRLKGYERSAVERVAAGVVVAARDRSYLTQQGFDGEHLHVITNGTDVQPLPGVQHEPHRVAFLGNLRSAQNEDMVLHFVRDIWPLVRRELPEAQFDIVGANASRRVRALAEVPGVMLSGRLPDVAGRLSLAAVSVCPMRFGAGVQNKILESMALGVPVVTTPVGLEGIDADPGSEIVVADDPAAFAAEVVAVLRDDQLRDQLAKAGTAFIDEHFRWDAPMTAYGDLVEAVAAAADERERS